MIQNGRIDAFLLCDFIFDNQTFTIVHHIFDHLFGRDGKWVILIMTQAENSDFATETEISH